MIFKPFLKPVPIWFYLGRFMFVVLGLVVIAFTSDLKPVSHELTNLFSELSSVVRKVQTFDEASLQQVPTKLTQQSSNGVAQ